MNPRAGRAPVLFDQATAPLGQDASGRYYLVRLADDPTAARLLKRFDHPGWRTVATRPLLAQQLWRLVRLNRPELPGMALEDLQADGTTEGVPPYACVLDAPPARRVAERLPLGAEEAGHLVARLLETLWAAHQARVTGLRFDARAMAWDGASQWRWLAPDLVPPAGPYEAACRDDLLALARFARTLVAELPADTPLAAVITTLTGLEATPAAIMQQAFVRLGHELPLPTLPASTPLLGAESELETLGAWLRKCAQERRLHTLWLQGDPGSLQWDLAEALMVQVRPANMRVAIARCQADHTPETFLTEVTAQLEAMRDGRPASPAPPPDLPPRLARLRQLRAFRELLADVAGETPLCLAWLGFEGADGLIQELVAHLRQHAEGLPVLLVLGTDADAPDGSPGPEPEDDVLLLRPLFRAEVERLARAHCPGLALGQAAIDAAWTFSAGQPAQVYRLCLHWLRNGGLRQDAAGAWIPRDDGPRLVPPEVVREFLRAFATQGPAAGLTTMQALMDMPPATFFELLESALDGGWLRQEHSWLAFWRPDEGRALAAQMSPADALRWHRRLAAVGVLPAASRAFHAARGGQDAMAAPFIAEAGRRLLLHGALEAAAGLFRLGLEVAPEDDPHRLDLLEGLTLERLESEEPAQALALLVAELGRPGGMDEPALGRLAMLQGRARALLGDLPGARSAYERALPRLAPEALAARTRVTLALAELAYGRGERESGQALAAEGLALAADARSETLQAEAQLAVAHGLLLGARAGWEEGLALLAKACALGKPAGQLEVVANAHGLAAQAHRAMEHLGYARQATEAHVAHMTLLGRHEEAAAASLQGAWVALQMGLFDDAMAAVAGYEPDLTEGTRPERWVQATAIRALASLYLGYVHDPLRLLDQALRTARSLNDEALELMVQRQLVDALLFLGKLGRAEEVCQTGLGLAAALGDRGAELALRADLAEAAWRLGDLEKGNRLFLRVRDEATELGLAASRSRAMIGLAHVALERGEREGAQALATEAMTICAGAGHPWLCAEAALAQGDAALARDDREAARTAYEAARQHADKLNSPHHRALALFGLGHSVGEPGAAGQLLAQAADQLNVFLEQLSANGRKDFLGWAERRRVVEGRTTEPAPGRPASTSLPGTRSALMDLLKQDKGGGWGAMQDSMALLDEIFGLVTSRLPLDQLLARMNATFIRISQTSRGMVYLVNEDGELKLRDTQSVADSASVLGGSDPLAGVLDQVQRTGETVWVTNAVDDPNYAQTPEVQDHGVRGLLCIPLKVRTPDGLGEKVLGCLYGDRQAAWMAFGEKEVGLLEIMARYISVTLEIGVLQDESNRKAYRLEMMNDLSRALAGTLDLEKLLNLALMQIMRVSAGEQGYLFFGEDLKIRASLDHAGRVLTEIQVSRSVITRVARDRKPLTILDVGADDQLAQKASLMIRNVKSVMCVPLILDERLVGLIYVSSSTANKTFTRNDLDLMTAIASQVALALQNAQAYEIIKELNQSLEAKVKSRTSELEEAYRDLQETQAQLLETEKLATVGTLAGGVAHELNNPLGAVLTNAQLLLLDLEDPDQVDSLKMIEEGALRCKEIVAALLKYSRPPQASHRPVELRGVLTETLGLLERQLQQEGIELATDLAAEPTVMGDSTELRQVIAHLMLNAIDAIQETGAPGGRIGVRLARELDGVTLSVADNGVGMGPEVLKRIFDPFYTTKKVGSGTGLGLSVCQRIIEKHGGKLHVSSTPGQGSTFTLALPAA